MKPTFFANINGKFKDVTETVFTEKNNGLWQSIIPFDIDNDGDQDYLVGNWGMNSKFKASQDFPMKMYYDDFDGNGSFETIVAKEKNGKYNFFFNLYGICVFGNLVYIKLCKKCFVFI